MFNVFWNVTKRRRFQDGGQILKITEVRFFQSDTYVAVKKRYIKGSAPIDMKTKNKFVCKPTTKKKSRRECVLYLARCLHIAISAHIRFITAIPCYSSIIVITFHNAIFLVCKCLLGLRSL